MSSGDTVTADTPGSPHNDAVSTVMSTAGPNQATSFLDGKIHLTLDLRSYRLVAIQKAAYRMADRFTAILGAQSDNTLPVILVFSNASNEREAQLALQLFYRELLDQELREHIGEETRAVRNLILAHAFSKTDLIGR